MAFARTLTAVAVASGDRHPESAMLFVGVAVATLVASLVIEPATAQSAFQRPPT